MHYSVYEIRNKKQKLVYYGVSKDVATRFRSHKKSKSKRESALYDSFCKYGVDSFDFKVVFNFDNQADMLKKEIELIAKPNKGYTLLNRSAGGEYNLKDTYNDDFEAMEEVIRKVEKILKKSKKKIHYKPCLDSVNQWAHYIFDAVYGVDALSKNTLESTLNKVKLCFYRMKGEYINYFKLRCLPCEFGLNKETIIPYTASCYCNGLDFNFEYNQKKLIK